MVYYILGKNEDKSNLMFESNILGEESFGTFYPSQGFIALHNIIHTKPDKLEDFTILNEQGKTIVNINLVTEDNILKFRLKNERKLDRKSLNLIRNQEIQAIIR